ncbi:hypothetical protein NEOLEDRAFT_503567 [Neolentinus lepideus HHB14362 ss-1]|uniref:F-box domain-containing protein n=1 Tax=Neolentinus lepideus HHB14362 ss-1 TaxID=1314782 RepID=A0A165RIY4_9AGAM|nr:hypothetical protein NEOLEDRAFT_503567 [Neolentinus lepideus HHB14362 ss-1]
MANLGGLCPPTVSHIDTPTGRPPAALRLPFHIRSNICKILCRSRHYGRSTLYRLALSCKGYTNPALDILWAYMEGLEPLLNLMYSFNIQRDWRTGRITSVSSTEYNADDWHRFDTYATRVHWVDCIHDSVLDHLEGHIIRVIISHRPERNFLPNLRVLEWIHDDDKAITGAAVSLWSSILVPSLEHVDLHGMCDERRSGDIWSPQRDEALVSILESLPKRLPNLKWLRIHGNMAQCPIDFLQHFERLEFLNIRHILMDEDPIQPEPDTLTTLGIGLRKLKFLSLCIYRLGPDEVYGSDLFPSLEFLSLRATPVNVAGAIVNALGTTSLRVLKSSNHDDPVRSDELYDLLDSLSDRFAATLTTVHITMFGIKYLSEDDEAGSHLCSNASGSALMDTLRPLLDLPELRSVKLVVRPGWYNAHTVVESKCDQASLEDDDIRDMMLAWPKPHPSRYECAQSEGSPTLEHRDSEWTE